MENRFLRDCLIDCNPSTELEGDIKNFNIVYAPRTLLVKRK